jgi:hypothetical protein
MNNVHFHVGEVVANNNTYQYVEEKNFEIRVVTYTDFYSREEITAIPYDNNIKKIPAVGEHVLLIQGLSADNIPQSMYPQWYYLASFSINSDANNNKLTGYAKSDSLITGSIDLTSRNISWLQPFSGDLMIEGRFGNSIRLSSTTNQQYTSSPTWLGQTDGDPIIVLSNGRRYEQSTYVVENVNDDASSLYLTSTQKVSILLGDSNNRNPLSCFTPTETSFERSQFIGVADRIILKAKSDIAVIDSPRAIVLNTTGEVKIGNDEANISLVHGDVLLNVLQNILNQLNQPIQCGAVQGTFINKGPILSAQRQLQQLLNSKYFITKETY